MNKKSYYGAFGGQYVAESLMNTLNDLDDDFEKNIEDLFELLQLIKDEKPEPKELNIEIFIRNDSEIARALLDTA